MPLGLDNNDSVCVAWAYALSQTILWPIMYTSCKQTFLTGNYRQNNLLSLWQLEMNMKKPMVLRLVAMEIIE